MKTRRGLADRGYSRKNRRRNILALEQVESRVLMAVFTVTTTVDNINATAGDGSLRGEILASNATTTANAIVFNLPGGVQTFSPVAPLPPITDSLLIDGTTATGFNTADPVPLIQISGNNPNNTGGPAFQLNAAACELRDLIINNFNGNAVNLNGGGDLVTGCYIGLDPTGTTAQPNKGVGVLVASMNNTIGSLLTNQNVISANQGQEILISGSGATGNSVIHSYIGTNAAGTATVGTPTVGIEVDSATNIIGGSLATNVGGTGNLISGNTQGIFLSSTLSSKNTIQGNLVGTDITGNAALGNTSFGIYVSGATNNLIGGQTSGTGNVIDSNQSDGIRIQGPTATLNRVEGNLIGVGVNGSTQLGNSQWGVQINGANTNSIGGTSFVGDDPSYGNTIEFNGTGGVLVSGGTNDGILSNSIYLNNGPGIQISQSNNGVQPPMITSAQTGAGQSRISGTYAGSPNSNYRLQFFSSPTLNPAGPDGQSYLLGDLNITTDSTGNATFNFPLTPGVPVGYFLTATATQNVITNNNSSAFSSAFQVTQASVTDLSVTTSVPPVGPLLAQPYTYTLTVTNSGPNDATGVVLTDTLPTNSTFLNASSGTFSAGVLTDAIGTLAANSTDVITITVKPTSVANFTNTATVTGNELDPDLTNNTSTTSALSQADADLTVNLTAGVAQAPIGSPVMFTLSVGNNGPSSATGTVVTVQFPGDYTNISVSPDQGTYVINSDNSVTITLGVLPGSSASTTTLLATPTAVASGATTATAMSNVLDPNTANNTSTATVVAANAADLAVTMAASPTTVLLGNSLLYTLVVSNNGPSIASSPVLLDKLPAGLTFDSANSSAGPNGTLSFANGTVTVSLNPLAVADSDTIIIAVIPTVSGPITNTATIGDPDEVNPLELDPDLTNNTATTTVLVSPADVSVVVSNPADPLFLGMNAVFQIQVSNNGPATATNVVVTDTVQGGVIVAAGDGTFSGSVFNDTLPMIAAGQTITITIMVNPTVSGTLLDTATVGADQYDPNESNNTSISSNLVSPADLEVAVAGSPGPILVGQTLTYVVTITNLGPATATNVSLTDTLPAGSVLTSLVASQGVYLEQSTGTIQGIVGTLASGASATITIQVTPTVIANAIDTASVTSDNFDPDSSNNSASYSVEAINLPGTIQTAVNTVLVPENAGSVTITVDRVGGTLGTVTATYTTQNGTAIAGTNYVASAGLVTFLAGQTTATITIPVLDDGIVNGNNAFYVVLSNPTGGASLGSPSVTGVVVTNTDRDLIPPFVTQLIAIPNGNKINGFVLTFSEPMDPTRAQLLSNYFLFLSNSGIVNQGTPVALASAVYNPGNNSVILTPTAPLPSNKFYELVVNGSVGQALTDVAGNLLAGSSGEGTNYVAYYGQGTKLVYNDSHNNQVTLSLTGGGIMSVFRDSSGNATVVNLYGIVPHKSKISGSVKKLNKKGTGHTTIGEINGFGKFGDVKSSLTTPAFYVGSDPVTSSSVSSAHVSAASVQVPVTVSIPVSTVVSLPVTTKKVTPKGSIYSKH